VIRHHRLIELYLHRFLGYRWDEVHEEADKLEHAISEKLEDRMAERLGNPEADPHGHPIPRKDGTIPERPERVLLDLSVGQEATVSRVSDRDPEILRYLFGLRIVPGTQLRLTERGPFDGPLMLEIDGLEKLGAIGPTVASLIHVVSAGEGEHESEEGGAGETDRPGLRENGR
jgi:DtxR family Mn-dependent transcriptional regulator